MKKNVLNEITQWLAIVVIVGLCFSFYLRENRYLEITETYDYMDLKMRYKNYRIVQKDCVKDTMYYLDLKSPIDDSKDVTVKVKDYIYFNWFTGDYIK